MCSTGGGPDVEWNERLKASKRYRCKDCEQTFESPSKRPMCPSCQSEDVEAV
ncbi:hydrogenase maturation nickel metallochaperone HypA [Methanoculleus sp. FWC-SCC1]|uniref:Hydrogenase maturation nickel metallochaperone HypA n=1 Tax=Methanoculleus frigidifontis TaxID=2584085 RepID=A0ABT8M9S3_9EURY|nr:hydrogenase maturation nickel metallochaperone HypA [Methanoculleus sp. FWC-SCC1]